MSDIGSEKTPMYILIGIGSILIITKLISLFVNRRKSDG